MKYLIEIHHGIGDVVQMTGVVETIYRTEPDAEIDLIVYSESRASLFRSDTRVHHIYFLNIHTRHVGSVLRTVVQLRQRRYDYFLISPISNHRDAQLLALLVGAQKTYGEQLSELGKLSSAYTLVEREDAHIVERNNNLLKATGRFPAVFAPKLELDTKYKLPFHISDDDCVAALCIGTSIPAKTWAPENYMKLAEELEKRRYQILFLGGPAEANKIPASVWPRHARWHNYIGKTDLLETAELLQHSQLAVGGDTGAMHIAAAVGCTTVTLFSCSNPTHHAPFSEKSFVITEHLDCQYCYGTDMLSRCTHYKCITSIAVNTVLNLMIRLQNGEAPEEYRFVNRKMVEKT